MRILFGSRPRNTGAITGEIASAPTTRAVEKTPRSRYMRAMSRPWHPPAPPERSSMVAQRSSPSFSCSRFTDAGRWYSGVPVE